MSDHTFPSSTSNGTPPEIGGFAPITRQRAYEFNPPTVEQIAPTYGTIGNPPGPAHYPIGAPDGDHPTKQLRLRLGAVIAILSMLVLSAGGYSVLTHGRLAAVQTKADGLAVSLERANDSLATRQAELAEAHQQLELAGQELAASQEETAATVAALNITMTCAAWLDEAWIAFGNQDYDAASAALTAAGEPCDVAFGRQ